MSARRRQAGFTLVEMMTVVVIIGILAAIAVPYLTYPTDVETATRNVASAIGEGTRTAVSRGPLAPEIAIADPHRLRVEVLASEPPVVILELQVETGPASAHWYEIQRITMPSGIVLGGSANEADLTGGAAVTPGAVQFWCTSDGQCDPKTIYLQRNTGIDRYRIVIMPLSTAPQVFAGW